MKLAELPSGGVYVDTNVIYMYLRSDPVHISTIRGFLTRMVQGEIEAFIGVPVLDELFYRLLLAQIKEVTDEHPLSVLRKDLSGALEEHGAIVRSSIRQFITLPHLHVVGVDRGDGEQMMDNVLMFNVLPRDALHIAIMQRLNVSIVASDDTDFDRVAGIERAWLFNPPLHEDN